MAQYRKKPIVIEAMQFEQRVGGDGSFGTRESSLAIQEWSGGKAHTHNGDPVPEHPSMLVIDTLEGQMTANPGDWIIRGVQGEFYPCKPSIFEATYEPVL